MGLAMMAVIVGMVVGVVVVVAAAVLAVEGQVDATGHVGGGEGCADHAHDEVERVAAGSGTTATEQIPAAGVDHDLVLGPEPGEWEHASQRKRPNHERDIGLGHELAHAAHVFLHVEAVDGVGDRTGTEEEVGLEEGVGEEVEDRRRPGADAQGHRHVPELGDGRVGEHLLDVVLNEGEEARTDEGHGTDRGEEVDARALDLHALPEDREEAGDHIDAGDDHRGGVDERRDRRGSGHGVGQPGVQHELARLRHHGDRETGRSHHECGVAHTALEDVLVDRDRVEGHALPAAKNSVIMPTRRPTSPTRLVMKAFSAASLLGFSSHQ